MIQVNALLECQRRLVEGADRSTSHCAKTNQLVMTAFASCAKQTDLMRAYGWAHELEAVQELVADLKPTLA